MIPTAANATLTKIEGGGKVEGFRTDEEADATKFSGASPCYVSDHELDTELGGDFAEPRLERSLTIDGQLLVPKRGWEVFYQFAGEDQHGTIRDIQPVPWDNQIVEYRLILEAERGTG